MVSEPTVRASVTTVGTHDVLFCRVVALRRYGLTENLIYLGRAYHSVRTCSN